MGFDGLRLLRLLLPPACPLCGRSLSIASDDPCCRDCMAAIQPLPAAHCPRCALPYVDSGAVDPHLCSRCIMHSPAYVATYAAGLYEQKLRHLVQQFKFYRRPGLDRGLALLLDRVIPADLDVDLLIPVPLHASRLRQRTYNQSLLLARELGRRRGLTVDQVALQKIRRTDLQQELSARRRRKNLAGAFCLRRSVTEKRILLVDDVMTTGVTVELCSRTLLAGGAAEVRVAVVGRAAL